MQRTKKLLFILILFFSFSFSLFAQTNEEPIDLTGKWALQFQIDRYFTLSDFQGGTISCKYHFSSSSALRFGVTLGYAAMDNEQYSKEVYSDTTIINDYKGELSSSTIQLNLQYLYYLEMNNSIAAFGGIGLNYLMSPMTDELIDNRTDERNISGYGLDLLMGVEWFVRSNIGIHAEYGTGFGYSSMEQTYERVSRYSDDKEMNKDYYKTSGFSFSDHRVKFGVSVYF